MVTTALFGEKELTGDSFRSLLDRLAEEYSIRPLSGQPSTGDLLLRHDVSLSLSDAVEMAKAEANRGVRGTYCIMLGSPLFNPLDGVQQSHIREIQSYGHEIGLVINPHDHWEAEPDADELAKLVSSHQNVLDTVVDDTTSIVAFHRPPSWVQGQAFPGFQNASGPEYTEQVITDGAESEQYPRNESVESAQLVLHPGLWVSSESDYERKIERSVIDSCRYVNRRARAEFVDPKRG